MTKKKNPGSPVTAKHKKVAKNLIENDGNLSQAVRDAGYSEGYAHSGRITQTKSWTELLEEFLPLDKLQEKHLELLNAQKLVKGSAIVVGKGGTDQLMENDYQTQTKALDMAYKLRGQYAPEKIQNVNPFEGLTPAEIDEKIEEAERLLKISKKHNKKNGDNTTGTTD